MNKVAWSAWAIFVLAVLTILTIPDWGAWQFHLRTLMILALSVQVQVLSARVQRLEARLSGVRQIVDDELLLRRLDMELAPPATAPDVLRSA